MKEKGKQGTLLFKLGVSVLMLLALFLVVYLMTVLSGSSSFFKESSEKNALLYFEEDINRAESLAELHYANHDYEVVK